MTPRKKSIRVAQGPLRGGLGGVRGCRLVASCIALFFFMSLPVPDDANAQKRKRRAKDKTPVSTVKESKAKEGGKNQVFDFTGLALGASMRTPQLLYFLERASEELERASLQRRSFVPEIVRSISEEGL
jgi:hypothetical protein